MSDLKMKVYLVNEIESEAGWGSKIDEQHIFPTADLAKEFVKAYNNKFNNEASAPSIYWRQDYIGEVSVNETQFNKFKYKGTLVVMPKWDFIGT